MTEKQFGQIHIFHVIQTKDVKLLPIVIQNS